MGLNVLVACEESQRVTQALRDNGIEAYSCDIIPTSGEHPEWHILYDVTQVLNGDCVCPMEKGENLFKIGEWDAIIAFPPCTYLTVTGNKWFKEEYKSRFPTREQDRKNAIEFFLTIANAHCEHIAIENPVGIMSSVWRKPDQYIEPYYFGENARKKTCLWLKNFPALVPTNIVNPDIYVTKSGKTLAQWDMDTMHLTGEERAKERSKTFPGVAEAMGKQWGDYLKRDVVLWD